MTIKEVEQVTSMTRANIRFYENEGLLHPERRENGYRNYSEQDVEVLKRIRLLRLLHVPLEEIRALQSGQEDLLDALEQQLAELEREKISLTQSQKVCEQMCRDGVQYETLDAQPYLNVLEQTELSPLQQDVVPRVYAPWQRYFARALDFAIVMTLWTTVLSVGFRVNLSHVGSSVLSLATIVTCFFLEPLCLSQWGTTPGKWIFGLQVTDMDGGKLSYLDAMSRTWLVLACGYGFHIPIYTLYRLWKSMVISGEGEEPLPWEEESVLVQRDDKKWRNIACVVSFLVIFGIDLWGIAFASMPHHRGDITASEFCENYNQLVQYYSRGMKAEYMYLKPDGQLEPDTFAFRQNYGGGPQVHVTEENGMVTAVSFSTRQENGQVPRGSYEEEQLLCILAFAQAERGGLTKGKLKPVMKRIVEHPFDSFEKTVDGMTIRCEIEHAGYYVSNDLNMLIPDPDASKRVYAMTFSIEKEGRYPSDP